MYSLIQHMAHLSLCKNQWQRVGIDLTSELQRSDWNIPRRTLDCNFDDSKSLEVLLASDNGWPRHLHF